MKAAGLQNTVASCGTAFGSEHANMLLHLSNLGRDSQKFQIVFCFDGDAAGTKAAKGVFEKNPHIQINSSVIQFMDINGDATDPCDYRRAYGDTALVNLVNNQKTSIVEFVLTQELKNWDIATPEGQSAYLTQARKVLDQVTDKIQHSSYMRKLATWTGIPHSEITNIFQRRTIQAPPPAQHAPQEAVSASDESIDPAEEKVLGAILQHPNEASDLLNDLGINESYFKSAPEVVKTVLHNAQGLVEELDHNDARIVRLLHTDTGLVTGRTTEGLTAVLKSYLKYRYSQDVARLNSTTVDFAELLFKQEELRKYYKQ
jgi:DNA primase